mmetsp:Transcript_91452/g.244879  ORF Transcript_91452/g.244879 Transcript_91452/m.244879 type:complete len:252 (+) Transcript_91452:287-1042(+)
MLVVVHLVPKIPSNGQGGKAGELQVNHSHSVEQGKAAGDPEQHGDYFHCLRLCMVPVVEQVHCHSRCHNHIRLCHHQQGKLQKESRSPYHRGQHIISGQQAVDRRGHNQLPGVVVDSQTGKCDDQVEEEGSGCGGQTSASQRQLPYRYHDMLLLASVEHNQSNQHHTHRRPFLDHVPTQLHPDHQESTASCILDQHSQMLRPAQSDASGVQEDREKGQGHAKHHRVKLDVLRRQCMSSSENKYLGPDHHTP